MPWAATLAASAMAMVALHSDDNALGHALRGLGLLDPEVRHVALQQLEAKLGGPVSQEGSNLWTEMCSRPGM